MVTALTLTTASVAVAGSGIGGVFNLGKWYTVDAITKLAGSAAGSSLQINNNSTGYGGHGPGSAGGFGQAALEGQ